MDSRHHHRQEACLWVLELCGIPPGYLSISRIFPGNTKDNVMQGVVYKVRFGIVNAEKGIRAKNVEIVGTE